MLPAGREAFLAELRALPAERRAAFLAALYEARGRRVDRDGTLLRIGPPDDRTVAVPDEESSAGNLTGVDGADAILVLDDGRGGTDRTDRTGGIAGDEGADEPRERPWPGDVERIDGAEVHRAALYAIDRSDCERLVEQFFGRSLSSFAGVDARSGRVGRESGGDGSGDEEGRTARAVDVCGGPTSERPTSERPANERPTNERPTNGGTIGSEAPSVDAADPGRRGANRGTGEPNDGDDCGREGATGAGSTDRRPLARVGVAVALVALGVALVATGAVPGTVLAPDLPDGTDGAGGAGTITPVTPTTPNGPERVAAGLGGATRTPGRGDTVFDVDRGTGVSGTTAGTGGGTAEGPTRPVGNASARLPPGVAGSGEIDEAALAAAHLEALANRSFRLSIVYREFVDGRARGIRREVIRVEGPERYRVDTYASGEFRTTPVFLEGGDVYANGSSVARRAGGDRPGPLPRGDAVEPGTDGTVPYGDAVGRYLRWFLSVEESTLAGNATVGGQPAYWLTIQGDPWVGVENTTGSVLVGRDGTVRELRRAYDVPDHPGTTVVVTLLVTDVGSTAVRPPEWYGGKGETTPTPGRSATAAPGSNPTSTPAESGDADEDRRSGA